MPKFVIERQYLVPMYQHIVVEAPDIATACEVAVEDDSWERRGGWMTAQAQRRSPPLKRSR